jgi:hypothetical protein
MPKGARRVVATDDDLTIDDVLAEIVVRLAELGSMFKNRHREPDELAHRLAGAADRPPR